MTPEEYDVEREYWINHWEDYTKGKYVPLWKQKEKKLFTDRRWTDIPQATVISHRELTEEEKKKAEEYRKRVFEKMDSYFKKEGEKYGFKYKQI